MKPATKPVLTLVAAMFIGTLTLVSGPVHAQVSVRYSVGDAPPPSRVEAIPPALAGYVWAPGYWNWNGSRHVWTAGHWERARSGQLYEPAAWRQEGKQWKLKKGEWKRARHDNGVAHKKSDRDDNDDRRDQRGHDVKHDKGNFCPPGQAKKGNC
ncbi:hypothetical protein BH11PSE11_BH11PSE11_33140 [soil metagenome]